MPTNKELKEAYKLLKFKMGVFQIRNMLSGKLYIGSSTNLDAIWNRHRVQLNFGNHQNTELQNDWKALGEDKFIYEILSELEQKDDDTIDYKKEVQLLEAMYFDELKPYGDKGYHKEKF